MDPLKLVELAKTEVLSEIDEQQLRYMKTMLTRTEQYLNIGNQLNNEIKKFQNSNLSFQELQNSITIISNTYGLNIWLDGDQQKLQIK